MFAPSPLVSVWGGAETGVTKCAVCCLGYRHAWSVVSLLWRVGDLGESHISQVGCGARHHTVFFSYGMALGTCFWGDAEHRGSW